MFGVGYGHTRHHMAKTNFWHFFKKCVFCVFWPFYAQILTKKPQKTQKSKNNENYEVFHKSTKCFNIQLGVEKYFLIFRFCFWPLFVTKNGIFVFFDLFMHKSLPKNPKNPKIKKNNENYKVFQKNITIHNVWVADLDPMSDLNFDPFL